MPDTPKITSLTKFIGIERNLVDLVEKKSTLLNAKQHPFSISDISQAGRKTVVATLTQGGWTLVGGVYEQSINSAHISENSYVVVIPSNADVDIVKAAELLPENISSNGSVKVFSTNQPTDPINVTLIIFI